MKVLLVSWEHPPVVVGGLGRHVHALARHLVAADHEVVVLCRQPTGTDATTHPTTDEVVDGVRVLAVAEDPLHLVFADDLVAWTLAMGHALLRAGLDLGWQPDVVHAHDWLVAHPAVALAQHWDVPLVATMHATEAGRHGGWISQPLNRTVHSAEHWLAHSSDALITCSAAMRTEVAELFAPRAGITVLHNGIDPVPAQPRPVRTGAPTLLFVGRLEWEKGVQDAIAALPGIRAAHPGTRLVVVGEGRQLDWLTDRARAHRVRRSVSFAGHLDAGGVRAWMATSDLALLPSRYEPFGIVALEAAAAGLPLVASTAGGLGEAVLDGVTGRSFTPGNVAGLRTAVLDVLDDPVRAAHRAGAARARLTTDFGWERIAADTAAVYARTTRSERAPLARPVVVANPLPHR